MIEHLATLLRQFPEAVAASLVIASVCSFLGVFVILKRVVFIGMTLSEVAACGIAAAMMAGLPPFLGAAIFTLLTVAVLSYPFEGNRIPRDAILGVIFVLASALSILLVARSGFGLEEVKALLYGDLILTSPADLVAVVATLVPILAFVLAFLRPLVYTFLDRDAARVLGVRVGAWEFLYFLALGLAVSAASKVAGALLVFCYLVVAPSAALLVTRRLGWVMAVAAAAGVFATVAGLYGSIAFDLPTNQTVAVAACALFALAVVWRVLRRR